MEIAPAIRPNISKFGLLRLPRFRVFWPKFDFDVIFVNFPSFLTFFYSFNKLLLKQHLTKKYC